MDKEVFIDFEEGEKFLASDHKTFLKRFYEIDLSASITSLKESHFKKDWMELKRNAHSLKGTSAYIGATTCKGLAEAVQLSCMENPVNPNKVNTDLDKLLNHLEALTEFLKKYFHVEVPIPVRKNSELRLEEEKKDERPSVIVKKIVPPISRIPQVENSPNYDEDEVDPYEEMNKQWRCTLL